MEKTKVAPKPKKKRVAPKPKEKTSEMISYSIKMVIPTGQYANIQPEIVVKSSSVEDAHDFIAPHMNKLWKEYYLINERRPEPIKVPVAKPFVPIPGSECSTMPAEINTTVTTAPKSAYLVDPKPLTSDTKPMTVEEICEATGGKVVEIDGVPVTPPASSVALLKATQAIESCLSMDALEIIGAQVEKSVKLTHEDKETLQPLLIERAKKLSNE